MLHRPSSGSFVSYAREFLGESRLCCWLDVLHQLGDDRDCRYHRRRTVYALLGAFGGVPQWVFALAALTIVGTMNMIGVKWFAEMEFWFALIKVLAIVTFWSWVQCSSVVVSRWMATPLAFI